MTDMPPEEGITPKRREALIRDAALRAVGHCDLTESHLSKHLALQDPRWMARAWSLSNYLTLTAVDPECEFTDDHDGYY